MIHLALIGLAFSLGYILVGAAACAVDLMHNPEGPF